MRHIENNGNAIEAILEKIKHFLPAQAPLKDFIHHNTLHAFQEDRFEEALKRAEYHFGYKTRLTIAEYRAMYLNGKINPKVLRAKIKEYTGNEDLDFWQDQVLNQALNESVNPKVGRLRSKWKSIYQLDLDNAVHPILFRLICSYLDQGIAISSVPLVAQGFFKTIAQLETNGITSFFKTKVVRELIHKENCNIPYLLGCLVNSESLFEQYLFDQQFAHQGWSGMVAAIERLPESLLDAKPITLEEVVLVELLLELDAIYYHLKENWKPIGSEWKGETAFFEPTDFSEIDTVKSIWQEAYEFSYYDQALTGIMQAPERVAQSLAQPKSFQAIFCIDDRECSIRRHLELIDPNCETFGTPGFFGIEFYYQPTNGKFVTKLCPAPITPVYLIKEINSTLDHRQDLHIAKHSHSIIGGWLIAHTIGFWSAFRLFLQIFKPSMSPAVATSLRHMDQFSELTIEHNGQFENGLQIGFTIEEMVQRIEGLLTSIGLVKNFAPLVYIIGHGSSSVNNPHYAAYDCGACSGRPGSVNARAAAFMANHPLVRLLLIEKGIHIPDETRFVAGLHDTTRDEIVCYDETGIPELLYPKHRNYVNIFSAALDHNAKERSRRFEVVNTNLAAKQVHEQVKKRSVSLFEPRPELNHATNALCIIGRRNLTRHLFLDRRAFMNSYDYHLDPTGKYLWSIIKAAAPVCGGINLEYYFSRIDNHKLGAGTKLPHNVMGLIGVANGIDGDLRPGLPSQMIEVHDPIRLMMIVEHYPEVVLDVIQQHEPTYEWFKNNWVHLVVSDPSNKSLYRFKNGKFIHYSPSIIELAHTNAVQSLINHHADNIPVTIIHSS